MATKVYPADYSEDAKRVLKAMSLGPGLKIMGSMSKRDMLYASDYDGYEVVKVKSAADAAQRFKQMIHRLLSMKHGVFIGDIKLGAVEEWNLLSGSSVKDGRVLGYNAVSARAHARALGESGVLSPRDVKDALKVLKPSISPIDYIAAIDVCKYHLVRWTPSDVLRGYTLLRNGTKYTLADGISTKSMTKVDVIALVQRSRFTDFSVIYEFNQGRKILNGVETTKGAVVEGIANDIKAYAAEGNYFKCLKRLMSIARIDKNERLVQYLTPILNSDLGRLSFVLSDIGTLLELLEREERVPEEDVRFEIDQYIQRLSNVSLKEIVSDKRLPSQLEAVAHLPLTSLPKALSSLSVKLDHILQRHARPLATPLIGKDDSS